MVNLLNTLAVVVDRAADSELAAESSGDRPAGRGDAITVLAPTHATPAALTQPLDGPPDIARVHGRVGVYANQPTAARGGQPPVERVGDASSGRVDQLDPRVGRGALGDDVSRGVDRASVDHDYDLQVLVVLSADRLQAGADEPSLVAGGYDNRDEVGRCCWCNCRRTLAGVRHGHTFRTGLRASNTPDSSGALVRGIRSGHSFGAAAD